MYPASSQKFSNTESSPGLMKTRTFFDDPVIILEVLILENNAAERFF
jgi:hypothetical protein